VKAREIQFEAVIEFNSIGFWRTGGGLSSSLRYEFVPGTKPLIEPFSQDAIRVSAGSQITISGTMRGHKTDNGWQFAVASSRINPGQIKSASQ
jgi:hypothetical protein